MSRESTSSETTRPRQTSSANSLRVTTSPGVPRKMHEHRHHLRLEAHRNAVAHKREPLRKNLEVAHPKAGIEIDRLPH